MKTYYHAHELAYQQIKSNGFIGWGNAKNVTDLGEATSKEYLTRTIKKYCAHQASMSALDLGCGTGATAFILAQNGLRTTGIDVSETAVAMARDLARQQNLDVQFISGDILDLGALNQTFDLVYDSHCLHCIVFEDDRKRVFDGIKTILNPRGILIVDTMVMPEGITDPTTSIG